jgi:hypothetical protein
MAPFLARRESVCKRGPAMHACLIVCCLVSVLSLAHPLVSSAFPRWRPIAVYEDLGWPEEEKTGVAPGQGQHGAVSVHGGAYLTSETAISVDRSDRSFALNGATLTSGAVGHWWLWIVLARPY